MNSDGFRRYFVSSRMTRSPGCNNADIYVTRRDIMTIPDAECGSPESIMSEAVPLRDVGQCACE